MIKKYLAVVKGIVVEDEFTINKPIGRNPKQPHKWVFLKMEKKVFP